MLRTHPDPRRVCTIEAIYRFLKVVENEAPAERLLDLFRLSRDRLLSRRGIKSK
jgi:DTW domain-containing protein YfiP